MKKKCAIAFIMLFAFNTISINAFAVKPIKEYNILDFGARSSKDFNSTKYIQAAIDQCAKDGGGKVVIPAGVFSTSTIRLKSNIDLHLDGGAKLYAIPDSSLYTNDKEGLNDAGDTFIPSLLSAKHLKNITISGNGAVIGQPEFLNVPVKVNDDYPGWTRNAAKYGINMQALRVKNPKISLVYISDCENVHIENVSIIHSPNWSCHIQWSKNVRVDHVKIMSSLTQGVNSDGLDIDGCKDVMISDCEIRTGDDAICIKTTKQGTRSETCENIIVKNCRLSSSSCALKIGTETYSNINNITFLDCQVTESNRGMGIIIRDGAIVSNVTFNNITLQCKRLPFFWWGNGEAFHFNVVKRRADSKIGAIKNLALKNIKGDVQGTSAIFSDLSIPQNAISGVTLAGINLTLHPEIEKDLRATDGIDITNAEMVKLNDVSFKFDWNHQSTWANILSLKNVSNYDLSNLNFGVLPQKDVVPVLLNNTVNGNVKLSPAATSPYIQIAGKETKDVHITLANKMNKSTVSIPSDLDDKVFISYN